MRRTLVLLGALGLLVSTTMIVRRADDPAPVKFCQAYGIIGSTQVEIDGERFTLGIASQEAELLRGCSHYGGSVILPNCDVWDNPRTGPPTRRSSKVGPFYSDGTCNGSGGGTHLDTAPPIVENPNARSPSPPRPPG